AANLEPLRQQLAQMELVLQQMLRQLPSKTEMPDLIVDISQTALASGLTNELFKPLPEMPREFYAEKPIELRMVGSYHQFGAFVSGVASLPRVVILTMHDISLKPKDRGGITRAGVLELSGTVKTYRYLDESEMPKVEPAGKAKGGKKKPKKGGKGRGGATNTAACCAAWERGCSCARSAPAAAAPPAPRATPRTCAIGARTSAPARRRRWIRCR